jgi:hypothetical protein
MAERRWVLAVRTGVAAAAVPGLVSAIITRLLMRAVTLIVNGVPDFTLTGSAGIAIIYMLFLLPGCLALALSRARWPWILFGAGAGVLLFEAIAIGRQETVDAHDMTATRWFALLTVLILMAAVYCAQCVIAARWARHHS